MDAIRPIIDAARPGALRTLMRAGAVDARSAAALAASLPWLLGRGPSLGILSRINSRAVGYKAAIHDRLGSVSWARLDRRAERAAGWLRGRGLRPGDRVATLLRNGREIVETILATQKAGLVACPLNTWARSGELAAVLERADPSLLIADRRSLEQVEEVAPPGLDVVVVGEPVPQGRVPYRDVLRGRPLPPFEPSRGRAGIVIHTSGTTGRPKGASRPGGGGLGELMALLSVIPFRRDDVIVCPAPLFHSFGLLTLTVGALLGATLVLPDRFDPEETLDLIERHRATASSLVPVMLRRIVTLPEGTLARHDVSSMRILLVSGSATPPELREAASALFGPVLHDLYGSTEAGWVSVATPEDAADHPASVGLPVPGVEVAVLDDAGRPLPAGQAGVLHVRSGAVFEGYTSGERAEARGGFLSLGDLGWLDEDGRLHVAGRADDMVVVGGENVYPAEVEEVLRALPGVEDVAVAGVPDEEFGQVLAAFVVGSVEPHDVIEGSRSRLASYKVPRHVRSVDELPRNASGKVLARELAVWLEGSPEKE